MTFEQRILPPLLRICHKLIDARMFGYVESISNFLGAITTGRWQQLPADERLYWIKKLQDVIGARALGDSWDFSDPDLSECRTIVSAEEKALKRLL